MKNKDNVRDLAIGLYVVGLIGSLMAVSSDGIDVTYKLAILALILGSILYEVHGFIPGLRNTIKAVVELPAITLPRITLPSPPRLAISTANSYQFVLGADLLGTNTLAVSNIRDLGHALRLGDTGSGKTNEVHREIHYLISQPNTAFYIVDLKGELRSAWAGSSKLKGSASTVQAATELLASVWKIAQKRQELFEREARERKIFIPDAWTYTSVTGKTLPFIRIYVDELYVLLDKKLQGTEAVNDLYGFFGAILSAGRSADVTLAASTPYLTVKTLSREVSKQFLTRSFFGGFDQVALSTVFGGRVERSVKPLIMELLQHPKPGLGVLAMKGFPPTVIQAPQFDGKLVQP